MILSPGHRRHRNSTPNFGAPSTPSGKGAGGRNRPVRRLVRTAFRQLLCCHLISEVDGASACSPAKASPVEPTRPHKLILAPARCGGNLEVEKNLHGFDKSVVTESAAGERPTDWPAPRQCLGWSGSEQMRLPWLGRSFDRIVNTSVTWRRRVRDVRNKPLLHMLYPPLGGVRLGMCCMFV